MEEAFRVCNGIGDIINNSQAYNPLMGTNEKESYELMFSRFLENNITDNNIIITDVKNMINRIRYNEDINKQDIYKLRDRISEYESSKAMGIF